MKTIVGWSSRLIITVHKHKELNELEKEKKNVFQRFITEDRRSILH